jgi:hypothetical protein
MFFIVWGKKLVYKKWGYVADFCPICRVPRVFEIKRIGVARHIYYLSYGEGELAGFVRNCCECSLALDTNPGNYKEICKDRRPFDELLTQTFPNLAQANERALALEERIKNAPESLTHDERRKFVRNSMLLISPQVDKRYASIHFDIQAIITLIGVITAVYAEAEILQRIAPDYLNEIILLCAGLGLALVIWQVSLSNLRFIKKKIAPALAKNLRPLRPTSQDIQSGLGDLAKMGLKLGLKLDARDLMAEIERSAPGAVTLERRSP